jgi:chromosome partitioning protein
MGAGAATKDSPMKTVAMIMQKGGVGKSTIARAMAVAAARAGYKTALIDMDTQRTVMKWADRREAKDITAIEAVEADLESKLDKAEAAGIQLAIIDTPPARSGDALIAADVADLVMVPIQPSPDAYEQLPRTARVIRSFGVPAMAVPSLIHPSSRLDADVVRETAGKLGIAAGKGHASTLKTHMIAHVTGQVAVEIEPDGRAAREMDEIFMDMCAQLALCKPVQA